MFITYQKTKKSVHNSDHKSDHSSDHESDGLFIENPEEDVVVDPEREAKDDATKTAVGQLEAGVRSRQGRFNDIAKSEAQYNGIKTKALRGRSNIPFDQVVARGFVDTLMSKIDESLQISFERSPGRRQDKKPAEKLTAVCDHERGPDQGQWDLKDIGVKKMATFSGRGIYEKTASRKDGEFIDHFEGVDHWDFVTEPDGGGMLDKHLFKGRMNIFMSRKQILDEVDAGIYDKKQAFKLFASTSDDQHAKNKKIYEGKISRATALGIDVDVQTYSGTKMYRLVKWVILYKGEWKYMIFSYDAGLWLQCDPLEEVFSVAKKKPGRGPWVSWATNYDPMVFWSIAPMDSVRAIAYAMKKVINLSLDNLEKRNWNQRAYNPNVFDPRDLLWKDQGLVKAKIRRGEPISNHIYNFETPDTTNITINLTSYLDQFLGQKTGITADAQGKSDEQTLGIYVGNIQQVADRLGLTNKMYEQAHVDVGVNFKYGAYDHLPEKYAVKVIGNKGIEWDEELLRKDLNVDFTVRVRGTNTEERLNIALQTQKANALKSITVDPELRGSVNKQWRLRETLSLGGYDQEEIRIASDINSEADDDMLSEAAAAIEEIISGRKPKKNRGATTGYIRFITEYAWDTDLDDTMFKQLLAFATLHLPIAKVNEERKARQIINAIELKDAIGEETERGGASGSERSPIQPGPGGALEENPIEDIPQ